MRRFKVSFRRRCRQANAGFTAIELLIIIAIIGILIALLLPAIQAAREAARQAECKSNMRDIALGVEKYRSDQGSYPPGVAICTQPQNIWATGGTGRSSGAYCQGPNWLTSCLAQLDQQTLADWAYFAVEHNRSAADHLEHGALRATMRITAADGSKQTVRAGSTSNRYHVGNVGTWTPEMFVCPSAGRLHYAFGTPNHKSKYDWYLDAWQAKGNYAACFGSETYMSFANPLTAGLFGPAMIKGWERKVPPPQSEKMEGMLGTWKMGRGDGVRSVPDGSSNTLMLSEVIGYDSIYDNRGAWVHNSPGSTVFTGYTTPNSTTPDMIPLCYESTDDGGGGIPEADIRHCTENRRDGDIWAAARSRHPGGVNVARADSSLAFVTDSVDPGVWKAMCTIDGPENEPNLLGNW